MTGWRPRLVVHPRAPGEATPLVPSDGEFVAAMRGLARRRILGQMPFEVPLTLYAYELLERLRELAAVATPPATVHAPFWPPAACAAASAFAPAVADVVAMYPEFAAVATPPCTPAEVAAAATALFGAVLFEPEHYLRALARGSDREEV